MKQAVSILTEQVKRALSERVNEGVVRLTTELADISPLEWLGCQTGAPRIYWRERDGSFETAGLGAADLLCETTSQPITEINDKLGGANPSLRYFGGFRFDPHRDIADEWKAFGSSQFILPRFELTRRAEKTTLSVNLLPDKDGERRQEILAELERLNSSIAKTGPSPTGVEARTDCPDKDQWAAMIDAAYELFQSEQLQKVVLARRSTLRFRDTFNSLDILNRLKATAERCFLFYFEVAPEQAFFGATPELLYARDGTSLSCEAIAGTRTRGTDESQDNQLGQELLGSDKDRREQQFVVESIKSALSPFREQAPIGISETQLLKLSKVQHLISQLEFQLKPDISDDQILSALHPTAAVGGSPKEAATEEIRRLEPFDRGWYAGPVGWISRHRAQFAVAIRSALASDNRLNLFAGAGILRGSRADSEWRELDSKISNFTEMLNR